MGCNDLVDLESDVAFGSSESSQGGRGALFGGVFEGVVGVLVCQQVQMTRIQATMRGRCTGTHSITPRTPVSASQGSFSAISTTPPPLCTLSRSPTAPPPV
jgi:hypothetical protein